jgi:hypothetical protein
MTASGVRREKALELRSLPSPGFTRLHRYYEPLRIPTAPGLSLAGVQLIIPDHVQPEATGAAMEVTKWLKPSDSGSRYMFLSTFLKGDLRGPQRIG